MKLKLLKHDVDEKNKIYEGHKEFIKMKKNLLKTQQRFKSEKHNICNKEINQIALVSNDDKRIQSVDLIEPYGTNKDLVSKKKEIKCNNILKQYKTI